MNIHRPSSGCTEVFGRDSRRLSPQDFAQIGYVSENQDIPDWMTVKYFLSYLKPFYPTWDSDYATELVRQFDLPPGRKIRHLSHGMRMKTVLASSLAYHPRLIVLDEPFAGLDPLVRDQLIEAVLENAGRATVLISSHDLAEIETFASHIGYLEQGRLQFSEEINALAARFREIEITFDVPPASLGPWPASWLNGERSATVVRFVETRFDEERTMAEIRHLFPAARQISANPMPLRAIFVALAKASRKAA